MEIVNKHEICTRPGHWPSQASYNFAINGMGIAGSVGRRGLWCLYSGSVVTSPHLHCLYTDVWCCGVSDVWCCGVLWCLVLWSVVVSGVVECRLWTGWAGSWAVAGQTAAAPHKWMGPGLSVAGHQGWRHGVGSEVWSLIKKYFDTGSECAQNVQMTYWRDGVVR